MKYILFIIAFIFFNINAYSQFEVSTGYAINKRLADGVCLNIGYEFNLRKKVDTKSQIGYKNLYHFNDFVGVVLKVRMLELHQTFSYEIIKKNKYIFKPNLGLSFRIYKWKGFMQPPLNQIPTRVYQIGFSNNNKLKLVNNTDEYEGQYKEANYGFCIQLTNQFKLNKNLLLLVTPFLEPDFDRIQNTGGVYIGVAFKNF